MRQRQTMNVGEQNNLDSAFFEGMLFAIENSPVKPPSVEMTLRQLLLMYGWSLDMIQYYLATFHIEHDWADYIHEKYDCYD